MNKTDKILIGIIILFILIVVLLLGVLFLVPLLSDSILKARSAALVGTLLNFFGTILLLLTVLTSGGGMKGGIPDAVFGADSGRESPESAKYLFRSRYAVVLALALMAAGFFLQFSDVIISFGLM